MTEAHLKNARLRAHSDAVCIGYAQLMRKFQLLEMNLWAIKTMHFKPGMQLQQALDKLAAWDASVTFGQLVGQVRELPGWPDDLLERLETSTTLRNYLAHRFLREFFAVQESMANYQRAISHLTSWAVFVDGLDADVEAQLEMLTGGEIDEDLRAELARRQPTDWPLTPPEDKREQT